MNKDSDQFEEPCLCDCGEWFNLQDGIPCGSCENVYCPECLKTVFGKCNMCLAEKCL